MMNENSNLPLKFNPATMHPASIKLNEKSNNINIWLTIVLIIIGIIIIIKL